MPSLSGLYAENLGGLTQTLGSLAQNESDVLEDKQLNKQRLLGRYQARLLPELINRQAARGVFWSTPTRTMSNELAEDVGIMAADLERLAARQRAALAREGLLASLGTLF